MNKEIIEKVEKAIKLSLIEELNNITKAIERMASNSIKIKSFTIIFIGFSLSSNHILFGIISIICIFVLSWLDAYYLSLERGFRNLYNKVRLDRINNLNIDSFFEMKPIIKDKAFKLIFTKSIAPYYLMLLLLPTSKILAHDNILDKIFNFVKLLLQNIYYNC